MPGNQLLIANHVHKSLGSSFSAQLVGLPSHPLLLTDGLYALILDTWTLKQTCNPLGNPGSVLPLENNMREKRFLACISGERKPGLIFQNTLSYATTF